MISSGRQTVFTNGQEVTQYTFKQDYYWMMGDNRHKSEDSRFWGFVPADHIVGKPVFIWFSIEALMTELKIASVGVDYLLLWVSGKPDHIFPILS